MCGTNNDHAHACEALPAGTLKIILLPDGRIRIETGSFAGATHASAAAAIPALAKALGVTFEESRKIVKGIVKQSQSVKTTVKVGS